MPKYAPDDLVIIRLLRAQMGQVWADARPRVEAALPDHIDPALIGKWVDERAEPGIHINEFGVEPRFYPHRVSGRLLEFYRSVG